MVRQRLSGSPDEDVKKSDHLSQRPETTAAAAVTRLPDAVHEGRIALHSGRRHVRGGVIVLRGWRRDEHSAGSHCATRGGTLRPRDRSAQVPAAGPRRPDRAARFRAHTSLVRAPPARRATQYTQTLDSAALRAGSAVGLPEGGHTGSREPAHRLDSPALWRGAPGTTVAARAQGAAGHRATRGNRSSVRGARISARGLPIGGAAETAEDQDVVGHTGARDGEALAVGGPGEVGD